jgi:hypothetical protein
MVPLLASSEPAKEANAYVRKPVAYHASSAVYSEMAATPLFLSASQQAKNSSQVVGKWSYRPLPQLRVVVEHGGLLGARDGVQVPSSVSSPGRSA